MSKLKLFFYLLTVIIITLLISVCAAPGGGGGGGGGGTEPGPIPSHQLIVIGVDDSHLYTIISAQPSGKPEANSAPSTFYPFSLTSTAGTPSIIAPLNIADIDKSVSSDNPVYSSKQTNCDLFMRDAENQVLSNKAMQLSKKASGIDKAAPKPIVVGTTWNDVNIYDGSSMVLINTTCEAISNRAYFFVDNNDIADMAPLLVGYCASFDAIYDVNHAKFGEENDTDTNGKVIIVFSEELTGGLLGYFYSHDKYPKATYADSNEGDIFYMTTDAIYQGNIVNGTLAHEFQHMIYFDEHYDRGVTSTFTWLNEALSQVAEYYNGYTENHLDWIENYLKSGWSAKSLTHWTSANYGYGALYIRYLRDRFGDAVIKNMCSTNLVGVAAVEGATGTDFNTIFNDFTCAIVLSGTGDSPDPKHNFTTLDLQAVQPVPRGGLTTPSSFITGDTITGSLFAYRIFFASWTGIYDTMIVSGTGFEGTVFRISR